MNRKGAPSRVLTAYVVGTLVLCTCAILWVLCR